MIDTATYTQLQQDVGDDLAKQLLQVYITESAKLLLILLTQRNSLKSK